MQQRVEFPTDWKIDHGDRLFKEGTLGEVPPWRGSVLVGLTLLCFLPRAWAVWLHDIQCPDAVSYIQWTEALARGDVSHAFSYTGINIYPVILLGLKLLAADWLVAAKWWSVLAATATVLPLFGWIRRQFNETVAILGCVFYALHPAMVHDSPLVIRDPTFWLLFALGLYSSWRAVAELRWRWFGLFALVFVLAIHLRTEGWLLVPVVLCWAVCRLRGAGERRMVLIVGTCLALSIGPVVGKVVGHTLSAYTVKSVDRTMRHLPRLTRLVTDTDGVSLNEVVKGASRNGVRYVKAFGYVHVLLAVVGALYWRRRLVGPSKGPLLLFCILSAGSIAVCFGLVVMDRRYAYPSVMISLPTIAVGLCAAAQACMDAANRKRAVSRNDFAFRLLCLTAVSTLILSFILVTSPRPMLHDQAELGRWIRQNLGPDQRIAPSLKNYRLVAFYAQGRFAFFVPPDESPRAARGWIPEDKPLPDVVLIWLDWHNPGGREAFARTIAEAKQSGFREVPAERLPEASRHILVLVREATAWSGEQRMRRL